MLRHVAQTHRHRRRRPRYLPQVGLHLTAGVIDLQPELSIAGLANSLPALEFVPLQIFFNTTPQGLVMARPSTIMLPVMINPALPSAQA